MDPRSPCLVPFVLFPTLGTGCISLCIHGSGSIFLYFLVSHPFNKQPKENLNGKTISNASCYVSSAYSIYNMNQTQLLWSQFIQQGDHGMNTLSLFKWTTEPNFAYVCLSCLRILVKFGNQKHYKRYHWFTSLVFMLMKVSFDWPRRDNVTRYRYGNVINYNLRIIQEYFQPKIGRKIRIFSLGQKNNILIEKKGVCANMGKSGTQNLKNQTLSRGTYLFIIQLSYTVRIPIFWWVDLYHVTLGYD